MLRREYAGPAEGGGIAGGRLTVPPSAPGGPELAPSAPGGPELGPVGGRAEPALLPGSPVCSPGLRPEGPAGPGPRTWVLPLRSDSVGRRQRVHMRLGMLGSYA